MDGRERGSGLKMGETKTQRRGSNLRCPPTAGPRRLRLLETPRPVQLHDRAQGHRPVPRRADRGKPDLVTTPTPRDTGRPHSLALPASHETWLMLQRFNKVALAKRFPGWDAAPLEPTGHE